MTDRVFVIGAGRVGRALALALRTAQATPSAGVRFLGLHGRAAGDGVVSSAGAYPAALAEASVVVLAVRDAQLDEVVRSVLPAALPRGVRLTHGAVVLQTAGAATAAAFGELRALGIACGTFHPLVPVATPERGAAQLHDGWVGIDGDAAACAAARRLAAAVGARTVTIPAGAKPAYHAAAVLASNFPVVLAALAVRTLVRVGIDAHAAEQVVQRLVAGAAENLAYGAPAAVLTGPAARGDRGTIEAHRAALRGDPVAAAVYDALTRAAEESAASQRAPIDDPHAGGRDEAERPRGH